MLANCGIGIATCPNWRGARRVLRRTPLTHQPACKPGSVGHRPQGPHVTAIPLERQFLGASSNLPGRPIQTPISEISPRAAPIRFCSRWGLPCRSRCRNRGALLPHRFTLAREAGGLFSVALSLRLPPPDVIRHRMSKEPGLSSPAIFRSLPKRPSSRLTLLGMGVDRAAVKCGWGNRDYRCAETPAICCGSVRPTSARTFPQ